MSYWIRGQLKVLAHRHELSEIRKVLQQPGDELVRNVADMLQTDPKNIAASIKEATAFSPSNKKENFFENVWKDRCEDFILEHIHCVSRAFPEAAFLLCCFSGELDYEVQILIIEGRTVRDYQTRCGLMFPNLFTPYRREYDSGTEWGSHWEVWLSEMETSIAEMKIHIATLKARYIPRGLASGSVAEFERSAEFCNEAAFELAAKFVEHQLEPQGSSPILRMTEEKERC